MMERLSKTQATTALETLQDWRLSDDGCSISHTFTFDNFAHAFGFMARCALKAEEIGHHPDWTNSYNRVEVTLSTHDAGGLTAKDFELASAMDSLAEREGTLR